MTEESIKHTDYYATSDLGLTAVLSLYYPLEGLDRQNPRKAEFLFKRSDGLDQLLEAYWRQELQVEPQAYFNQLRVIKTRLYGGN